MSFLTIEEVIEEFDQFIDADTEIVFILDRPFMASDILRDIDHNYYCKQLDKFIAENYLVEGDESDCYYRAKS